ncbi:hypothetical protein PAXRUDRAFT_834756 [Paxillus rubicundulus Ve08.2h10]|uniref:Uncharacterized protein n=1 Tax=Paxillus rubicundulus Ve08.2h10 TaxID=930991 RepID=A0A0D0C4H9_9AGAM|nr:hypothetical protein PAXRUDRAFT_834756 [Paxillus rubicundulus Ve08.2h10]
MAFLLWASFPIDLPVIDAEKLQKTGECSSRKAVVVVATSDVSAVSISKEYACGRGELQGSDVS